MTSKGSESDLKEFVRQALSMQSGKSSSFSLFTMKLSKCKAGIHIQVEFTYPCWDLKGKNSATISSISLLCYIFHLLLISCDYIFGTNQIKFL